MFAENAPSAISLLRQPTGSWPNFCSSDQNQRQVLEKFQAGFPGATQSHASAMDRSLIGKVRPASRRGASRKGQWEGRKERRLGGLRPESVLEAGAQTASLCGSEQGRMSLHPTSPAIHPSLPPARRAPAAHGATLGSGLAQKVALYVCIERKHTHTLSAMAKSSS